MMTIRSPRLLARRIVTALLVAASGPGCAAYRNAFPSRPGGTANSAAPLDASVLPAEMRQAATAGAAPPRAPSESTAAPAPALAVSAPSTASTPSVPAPAQALPIDLPAALRLAEAENPIIGEARARIGIALAHQQEARSLLLPDLNAGVSYDDHTGPLQQSAGNIINVTRQSVYFGGGAFATAQNPPTIPAVSLLVQLTDVAFEPLAAAQRVDATRFDASATANAILLEVATLYQDLHRAGAVLEARRLSETEAESIDRIASEYARTGLGRPADADRARTQLQLLRGDVRRAEEEVARTSASLSRRLHLDPSARLVPAGDPLAILALVDPGADTESLVRTAVGRRPEVASRDLNVGVAETRLRQEQARPLLPSIYLGFSGADFGGGSNVIPPLVGRFGGRTDFDIVAYWTLENLGLGNVATQKQRRAAVRAAGAEKSRTMARVRDEVASARADALAHREQIRLAVEALAEAVDGFRKDLQRLREASGPTLEVLNNFEQLVKAREELIDGVIGFNQAQLRLFVAMGTPPPLDIPSSPIPPAATAAEGVAPAQGGTPAEVQPPARSGDGAGSLAAAHQETIRAAADYDRIQARLIDSLAGGKAPPGRDELLGGLKALAEAHRRVVGAQAEYDRTVWSLVDTPASGPSTARAPSPGPPDGPPR